VGNPLIVGDMAWPVRGCIDIDSVVSATRGMQLVVNLEGPILDPPLPPDASMVRNRFKKNLHSDAAVIDVMKELGVAACSLANNHVNDYAQGIDRTIESLTGAGIRYFGTKSRPATELVSGGQRYIFLGACSRLPEPKCYPGEDSPRIFNPRRLLDEIAETKSANPDALVVCVVHWGYELMLFPEPADREWAHRAIDAGADFVIGHHPHVVQGVEQVGNGTVAYSLGNFAMPHGTFYDVSWGFRTPEVLTELGIEIFPGGFRLHWFRYDKDDSRLLALTEDTGFDPAGFIDELSPFRGMSHSDYREWFMEHGINGHLTKRRSGPVYRSYFGIGRPAASANDAYMITKRRVRKVLMGAGLHTPRDS
jgi:hypothetical protein